MSSSLPSDRAPASRVEASFAAAVGEQRGSVDNARLQELTTNAFDLAVWQLQRQVKLIGRLCAWAGVEAPSITADYDLLRTDLTRHGADTLRRFPRAASTSLLAPDCYDAAVDTAGQMIVNHRELPLTLIAALSEHCPLPGDNANWSKLLGWANILEGTDLSDSECATVLRRDLARSPLR